MTGYSNVIKGMHHSAYRCKDSEQTRQFYEDLLGLRLALAMELTTTATGRLARLWRPVGELRSIGVWRAGDEEELHEKVLGTLPLRPWMTVTVTPLESHPNDPGRGDGT